MAPQNSLIRDESANDISAIGEVTEAAFASLEISGHTEQFIVAALHSAGALNGSLDSVVANGFTLFVNGSTVNWLHNQQNRVTLKAGAI